MFDRKALFALQDAEEQAFRALPPEVQAIATGAKKSTPTEEEKQSTDSQPDSGDAATTDEIPKTKDESQSNDTSEPAKVEDGTQTEKELPTTLPPLLSEEQQAEKKRLLSEGYSDWSRYHYSSFVKASAKYGRHNYAKVSSSFTSVAPLTTPH
jgi:SWI/SNF-related matrix-associated actin-dependent regulator of chromatin subfamily A member 5